MAEQKLSTAEILAKLRASTPSTSADATAAPVAESASAPVAEAIAVSAVEAPAPKASPAAKPGSPADVLAAIRAQAAAKGGSAPAAKPATPKPGATSDILAAIRAGKGGAAASEVNASAPKATPAKSVAAASSGAPKPSVEEMLKAVRGGAASVAPMGESAKPVLPPLPVKPVAAKDKKVAIERRSFVAICFSPLVIAFGSMAATSLLWVLDLARFMFPNVLVEPPTKFKIGSLSDYPLGTVSTKWLAARGIWIVHTDQYKGKNLIYALASVCTHLGCTPNWLEGEQKYKCPCHGSGFYVTGINFEGPAPRPLERVGIRVAPDGMLEVDKSVKFQEEMGQWQDPNSFVDATLA